MKKIFFLNFWDKGGMKHYSDSLVNILVKKNIVVYISNYDSKFKCKKFEIDLKLNPFKVKNYFELKKIISLMKIENPSVIHINSGFPPLLFIYPYFKNKNSIITIHDAVLHEGESRFKKIYHKIHLFFIYLFIDKVIVHSEKIKSELPSYFKKKKIYTIPHVNYNYLADTRKQIKKDKRFVILFFGRILPYKGLKYLVESFKKLPKDKYKLIIAGEGKTDCDIPNKDNIEVINRYVSDEEMKRLFSLSDASVLPYISASQSGVAYLSFAFHKPVIATNVGSIPDLVKNNFNGILIKPRSPKEVEKAILRLSNKDNYNNFVRNIKNQNESSDKDILIKLNKVYKNEI